MKAPPIVYLDTSDFNNLYKQNIPAERANLRDYLINKVDAEEIKIGYSYPLIFELFRSYDEKHREDRLAKAAFVKRLCGSNAHPHVADLDKGHSFPNGGIWVPHKALTAFSPKEIISRLKGGWAEKVDQNLPNLNRKQRRALKTSRAVSEIMRHLPKRELKVEDFEGIPISQSFLNGRYLERMLGGEISERIVSAKIIGWAMNPEAFVQIWYEYSGKTNPLEALIDDQFRKLSASMRKAKEKYEETLALRKSVRASRRRYHDALRKIDLPDAVKGSLPRPSRLDFDQDKLENIDFTGDHGERWKPFNTYMAAIISGKHQAKQSDLVDLIHLLYLPDVDLMRCDRRMSDLMANSSWFDTSKIVSRLQDLPNRIDKLIN